MLARQSGCPELHWSICDRVGRNLCASDALLANREVERAMLSVPAIRSIERPSDRQTPTNISVIADAVA
jgi:hypothetical protein